MSDDESDDDIIIEELDPSSLDTFRSKTTAAEDDEDDDDIVIEEIDPKTRGAVQGDDDDDDIKIEEVDPSSFDTFRSKTTTTTAAEDDSDDDDIVIEEVDPKTLEAVRGGEEESDDDDDIVIEEVDPNTLGSEDDDDTDDDDDNDIVIEEVDPSSLDDEDDFPSVEFVAPPNAENAMVKKQAPLGSVDTDRLKTAKREEGNAHFGKLRYKDAITAYTQGLELDPYDVVLYSNRAASYIALGQWREGKEDAEECVKLDPGAVKGWYRLGTASVMLEEFQVALEACRRGLEALQGRRKKDDTTALRRKFGVLQRQARRDERKAKRRAAIQKDLRELCEEMTPEERRWKAFWAGRGHPSVVDNSNLEKYVPDAKVDVSYDPDVSKALKGPDNLPRLDDEDLDDDDEDDVLLEEVLHTVDAPARAVTLFEDIGCGPRSLLTCARLPALRETALRRVLEAECGDVDALLSKLAALGAKQALDCLDKSWTSDSLLKYPDPEVATLPGIGATYADFAWRQKVNEIELRILLPPFCSGRDLRVVIQPRRIVVAVKAMRFWPYEKNSWTKIADVGPKLENEPPSQLALPTPVQHVDTPRLDDDSDDDSDDSDEPLVEELPFDDDDDDGRDVECAPPPRALEEVPMTVEWREDGVVLKILAVTTFPLVDKVKAAIAVQAAIPPHLQHLATPGGRYIANDDDLLRHVGPEAQSDITLVLTEKSHNDDDHHNNDNNEDLPAELVLLDMATRKKIYVDDSIWHVSRPESLKGHALQAPVLVMQLKKFQDIHKGTVRFVSLIPSNRSSQARHAGDLWWRTMFLDSKEQCDLDQPPTEFYDLK